jgi:hypothetical protein
VKQGPMLTPTPSQGRMLPTSLRWAEFLDRLEGPEGCNFRYIGDPAHPKPTDTTWDCASGGPNRHAHAHKILAAMGLDSGAIDASCAYFDAHGGYCDCEILFNVGDL